MAAAAKGGYEYVLITDDDFAIESGDLVLSMAGDDFHISQSPKFPTF